MKNHKRTLEELRLKYDLTEWELEIIDELRRKRPALFTELKHVSQSGMFRRIRVYYIRKNEPICLDYLISKFGTYTEDRHKGGLRVSGCGMDMGFHVVYGFSRRIFPYGFRLKKGHWGRNGDKSGYDKDGGYGLRQRWL